MTRSHPNLLRNRLIIIAICLIGTLPFGAAWYLAQHPERVSGGARANRGNLIDPARPLGQERLLQHPLSPPQSMAELKGHWIMLLPVTGSSCSAACLEAAQKTGRIHVMLSKELSRVRRLLLAAEPARAAAFAALADTDPTLLMTEASAEFRRDLEDAVGQPLQDGMLILMDPLGNVMLWYPADFDPYAPLKDLQRLLRISQIG